MKFFWLLLVLAVSPVVAQTMFTNPNFLGQVGIQVRPTGQTTNYAYLEDFLKSPRVTPVMFSTLATCAVSIEGQIAAVNDSNTTTWGATIAGGSTNHVLAYCDGPNATWTVMAK